MSTDLAPVGASLAGRLRDIAAAVRRHDGFLVRPDESTTDAPAPEAVTPEVAREFVLRMLCVAASPRGADLLRELCGRELSTAQLATRLDRPRLAVWEQVNDLMQVGLVGRDGLDDRVGLTAAGSRVSELIDDLAQSVVGA